jgi:hypothetical protein
MSRVRRGRTARRFELSRNFDCRWYCEGKPIFFDFQPWRRMRMLRQAAQDSAERMGS